MHLLIAFVLFWLYAIKRAVNDVSSVTYTVYNVHKFNVSSEK